MKIVMGFVMAASLIACLIDGTFEYLSITAIAFVIALVFNNSISHDDRSALEMAQDGMKRKGSRAWRSRFPTPIESCQEASDNFGKMLEEARQEYEW